MVALGNLHEDICLLTGQKGKKVHSEEEKGGIFNFCPCRFNLRTLHMIYAPENDLEISPVSSLTHLTPTGFTH